MIVGLGQGRHKMSLEYFVHESKEGLENERDLPEGLRGSVKGSPWPHMG